MLFKVMRLDEITMRGMGIEKTRDQNASKFRGQGDEAESAKVTEIKQLVRIKNDVPEAK